MTKQRPSPIRDTDDAARATAQSLIKDTRHAALAVLDETGTPSVTRVAFGQSESGELLALVSDLSAHSKRLKADPRCSLLIGDPPAKGDPLAFARLSITAEARFLSRDDPDHDKRRAGWLATHPKSGIYVDFTDFNFVVFTPSRADLNGGFGKAYQLTADDLAMDI